MGFRRELTVDEPRDRGLGPDGAALAPQRAGEPPPGTPRRNAVRSRPFIGLYTACMICSFGLFVPFVHLVPYAVDHGVPRGWVRSWRSSSREVHLRPIAASSPTTPSPHSADAIASYRHRQCPSFASCNDRITKPVRIVSRRQAGAGGSRTRPRAHSTGCQAPCDHSITWVDIGCCVCDAR